MDRFLVQADRALRKRVIIGFVATVLLGAIFLLWVLPAALDRLLDISPRTALQILYGVLTVMMLSAVAIGGYCFQLGNQVLQHQCFPPPGVHVIQDTALVHGKEAQWRGRLLVVGAAVLMVVGLFGAMYTVYLALTAMD